MTQTPEQIAASLTKAQREALLTNLFFGPDLRAELADKWLIETHHNGAGVTVKVLPLGQQVRTILENRNDAG